MYKTRTIDLYATRPMMLPLLLLRRLPLPPRQKFFQEPPRKYEEETVEEEEESRRRFNIFAGSANIPNALHLTHRAPEEDEVVEGACPTIHHSGT